MNKLLVFPLGFMFMLTLFSIAYDGTQTSGSSDDYSNLDGVNIDGDDASVTIPEAETQEFNIWSDSAGAMIIMTVAVAVGIIAGINILGSGLSETSQKLIFNGVLFLGLWACFSAIALQFIFASVYISILWIAVTIMYLIGLGTHMMGSEA